jgi:threonine dehydratase
MPEGASPPKVAATRAYGATIVLHGANYDEAYEEARRIEAREGLVFIHPFDDDGVIAGQGTLGLELVEQLPDLELVYVAVGGAGLIGGVATALKERKPGVRVIGVETRAIPRLQASLRAGQRVTLEAAQTIADGIACRSVGERNFPLAQRYVDEVVAVDDEEIAAAVLLLLEREKALVEGAGAAPLAALLRQPPARGTRVALVVSGGNIDLRLLARLIERRPEVERGG